MIVGIGVCNLAWWVRFGFCQDSSIRTSRSRFGKIWTLLKGSLTTLHWSLRGFLGRLARTEDWVSRRPFVKNLTFFLRRFAGDIGKLFLEEELNMPLEKLLLLLHDARNS